MQEETGIVLAVKGTFALCFKSIPDEIFCFSILIQLCGTVLLSICCAWIIYAG